MLAKLPFLFQLYKSGGGYVNGTILNTLTFCCHLVHSATPLAALSCLGYQMTNGLRVYNIYWSS